LYGAIVVGFVAVSEVYERDLFHAIFIDRNTKQEYKADLQLVATYVLNTKLSLVILCILGSVMGCALFIFLSYHLYLIYKGQTTNETFKWSTIRKVYKKLHENHEQYKKLTLTSNLIQTESDEVRDHSEVLLSEENESINKFKQQEISNAPSDKDDKNYGMNGDDNSNETFKSQTSEISSSSSLFTSALQQKEHEIVGCNPIKISTRTDYERSPSMIRQCLESRKFPDPQTPPGPPPVNIYNQGFIHNMRYYFIFQNLVLQHIHFLLYKNSCFYQACCIPTIVIPKKPE
jgi:hypothetical protein